MAVSTRHLHHHNLRQSGDNDVFDEENQARPRVVHSSPHDTLKQSSAVLDALSDMNSDLARFLFVNRGQSYQQRAEDSAESRGARRVSWFWFNNFTTGEDDEDGDDDMPGMNNMDAFSFALALEPMKIRNERVIMLFEGENSYLKEK